MAYIKAKSESKPRMYVHSIEAGKPVLWVAGFGKARDFDGRTAEQWMAVVEVISGVECELEKSQGGML